MTATSHGPTAAEQAKVSYLDVRDQFLAISNEGEYAEWLAKVGRYVHDRWLAEELTRTPGQPLDEEACKHLWDECSRKNLTDLQGEALVNLTDYRQRKVLASLGGLLTRGGRRVPVALGRRLVCGVVGPGGDELGAALADQFGQQFRDESADQGLEFVEARASMTGS